MKVLLGLTGSVACTLAPKLIKKLIECGHTVDVVITDMVETFIDTTELYDAGAEICYTDYDEIHWVDYPHTDNHTSKYKKGYDVLHVKLCSEYDVLLIAPITANTFNKMIYGICDNLLTSIIMAWHSYKTVVIAPAMNTHMWDKIKHMRSRLSANITMVEPITKQLACGLTGKGAMADIDEIVSYLIEPVWHFPVRPCIIPTLPHPGAFKFQRNHGGKHTGIDLYCEDSEEVYAVEDGTVVGIEHFTGEWDNTPWWNNTDCILVEGCSGVVCYGEIKTSLSIGDKVLRGQHIANVVRVIKDKLHPEIEGWKPNMLHLEWYKHKIRKASVHFSEEELFDPTPKLFRARDFILTSI
jgi:3-polyprenyl-4-hydroxybenzoate decarboxylase